MTTHKTIWCPQCKQWKQVIRSNYYKAVNGGFPLFCGRACSGLHRRKDSPISPRNPNWKTMKASYDRKRREANMDRLRAEKKAYYARTGPLRRDKERETRKKRMPKHIEYCRQPEYVAWKKEYDAKYRAKEFGEFDEAYMLLVSLEKEIRTRITRAEIYQQNGTANKTTKRKDEYARITGTQAKRR